MGRSRAQSNATSVAKKIEFLLSFIVETDAGSHLSTLTSID